MDSFDRRQPENAALRAKINRIQAASRQLQETMDQVQAQTVSWARQQKLTDLPNAELAHDLSATFQNQRATLAQIHQDIKGAAARELPQVSAQLVTDEELKALMK
mgnify:CR=1 FL=1